MRRSRADEVAGNTLVWVVCCIEPGQPDVMHIFSSQELADRFCQSDSRNHVVYDYALDFPERYESVQQ